ncbi:FecCD family ABC transporter permease [Elusimicrobiota bacterium]
MNKRYSRWLMGIFVLLLGLITISLISICSGSVSISIKKILELLLNPDNSIEYSILANIRLPRIILGFAIGGALSVAGVLLQGMFRNPLVEPYTLGISGGAALGVSLNIVLDIHKTFGGISLTFAGLLGALIVVVLVYSLSLRKGALDIHGILLIGVMISFMSSGLIMLIMSVSKASDLHGIIFWVMGSLEEPDWVLIKLAVLVSVSGVAAAYFFLF